MKKLVEYLVGDLEEKRAWKRTMKRVAALPADYRFACKQIMRYGFNFGFSSEAQEHLITFFEQSAAAGRLVQEVVGHDAAAFFDALMEVDSAPAEDRRQVLNREILEHFQQRGIGRVSMDEKDS